MFEPRKPPASRWSLRHLRSAAATLCLLVATASAAEAFDFADYVAERNLATSGPSMQRFPQGADAIHRFNGNLSYSIPLSRSYPVGGDFAYQLHLVYSSSVWSFDTNGSDVEANPAPRFNAGLGWSLSFGDLWAPGTPQNPSSYWVFCNGRGEQTRFYGSLFDGEPLNPNIFYSRDGSYRRLTIQGTEAVVETRDGSKKIFRRDPRGGAWSFDASQDVFGNFMKLTDLGSSWEISDSHGRVQKVFFKADPSGHSPQVIDRVEVTAFGGSVATYQFAYRQDLAARPSQDTSSGTGPTVNLSFLDTITRPDGTQLTMSYGTGTATPQDLMTGGRLRHITLPSGGAIEYTYQEVALPYVPGVEFAADVVGVATRTTRGLAQQVLGTWTLAHALDIPRVAGAIDQPRELTTTIGFPDGHQREYKFSVYVSGDASNGATPPSDFRKKRYSQAYTELGRIPGDLYRLSERVFDSSGELLESRSMRLVGSGCAGCFDMNLRIDRQRVRLHGIGTHDTTVVYSDFNDLGQYRMRVESDTGDDTPQRQVFVDYSDHRPLPSEPWILDVYGTKTLTQGTETSSSEVCIDSTTGRTTRSRVFADGAQRRAHDLLQVRQFDAAGNLSRTLYYGGDLQAVSTASDLCSLPLPSQEQYAFYQNHRFGAVEESGWLDDDATVFLETYRATVDPSTGLIATAARGDDFFWTYAYDTSSRQISKTPLTGHDGAVTVVFTPPVPGQALGGSRQRLVQRTDGSVLQQTTTVYGPFGQEVSTSQPTPGGTATSLRTYDAMGRLTSLTAGGGTTHWMEYDPFDRAGRIRPPEGPSHDRTYTYQGTRRRVETVPIGKARTGLSQGTEEVLRTTTTVRNRYGQRIEEHITDSDGASRSTTFTRNLAGHVLQTATTDGTDTAQWSSSDQVDGRGFRIQDGRGDAVWGYDALGKRTLQDVGPHDIVHVFDRAGRLIEQREGSISGPLLSRNIYGTGNLGANFRKGKLFQSQRFNRGVPHVPDGYVRVTDTLAYEGNGGGLSSRHTSVVAGFLDSMNLVDFESTRTVDGLGRALSLTYPACVDESTPTVLCQSFDERRLDFSYSEGSLTRVAGSLEGSEEVWLDALTFDADGFITERNFGNGWTEIRTPDVGKHRLQRLRIDHPSHPNFYDSGIASYDGKGRLVQVGQIRQLSPHAYSLDVDPLDGPAIPPPVIGPFPSHIDAFGLPIFRRYTVPSRPGVQSADGIEEVMDVFVYGPGNRLLWTRSVNDYDLGVFGFSEDSWSLVTPSGQTVRKREGQTLYEDGAILVEDATVEQVQLRLYNRGGQDTVYLGGKELGTASHDVIPRRTFFHYDLTGALHAISDDQGGIETNTMDLY